MRENAFLFAVARTFSFCFERAGAVTYSPSHAVTSKAFLIDGDTAGLTFGSWSEIARSSFARPEGTLR